MASATVAAWFVFTTVAVGPSVAPQQQQPPPFRAGVDLVTIDVQVIPAGKTALRDLTPADFNVSINDRPRPAVSATLLHLDEGPVNRNARAGGVSRPECVFGFQRPKDARTAHYLVGIAAIEADRKGIVVRMTLVDKAFVAQHFVWRTSTRPPGVPQVVSR